MNNIMVPDCIFLPMVQEDRLGQQLQEVPAHPERADRKQQPIKTYYNMQKLMHDTMYSNLPTRQEEWFNSKSLIIQIKRFLCTILLT